MMSYKEYCKNTLLFESPFPGQSLINPQDVRYLDTFDWNLKILNMLKDKDPSMFPEFKQAKIVDKFVLTRFNNTKYNIYQTIDSGNKVDWFTSNEGNFVYAVFEYDIKDNVMIEKFVWNLRLTRGIARMLLFDYYLNKFKAVISDDIHSPLGQQYWKTNLQYALDKNYKITILKINTSRKITEEIPFESSDLDAYWSKCKFTRFKIYAK